MEGIGELIRKLREKKGDPLRKVAAYLDIDQAILSKIERGKRKATKEQVIKLAKYFKSDEKKMLVAWLSDKIVYEIKDENFAEEALKVAEEKVAYERLLRFNRNTIIRKIRECLKSDGRIQKAWIFGSFSREDDTEQSDIDLIIEEEHHTKFNYFDLADIQFHLENILNRKVDIGFASSLRSHIAENIKSEAKLIYENV